MSLLDAAPYRLVNVIRDCILAPNIRDQVATSESCLRSAMSAQRFLCECNSSCWDREKGCFLLHVNYSYLL
jgi:hypothetical protein